MKYFSRRQKILLSILLVLSFVGATVLAWDIATTDNKLYIETTQNEDHFVVVCSWYGSGSFSLHGGAHRVDHKVLVGNSNTEMDCGWSLYGDLSVRVMHPLYQGMYGCDQPHLCESPDFRYEDGRMLFTPISRDRYLILLQEKYEGDELYDLVVAASRPWRYYYWNYLKVRELDIDQFKLLYHASFVRQRQIANEVVAPEMLSDRPEEAVEFHWEKTQRLIEEYHETK